METEVLKKIKKTVAYKKVKPVPNKSLWYYAEELAKNPICTIDEKDRELIYGSNMWVKLMQEEELDPIQKVNVIPEKSAPNYDVFKEKNTIGVSEPLAIYSSNLKKEDREVINKSEKTHKKSLWDYAEELAKNPICTIDEEDRELIYGSNMWVRLMQQEEKL